MWLVKLSQSDYKKKVRLTTAKIGLKSKTIDLDEETCKEIDENIESGDYNGAITCHRGSHRKLVVFFYPITDEEKAVEIYCHEFLAVLLAWSSRIGNGEVNGIGWTGLPPCLVASLVRSFRVW